MRSNYKKLGPYIRDVSEKNKDLQVKKLLGVSITKAFIPSIANIVGTDMSTYKIVRTNQFAYGPVTSRNGEKISVALLQEDDCIISTSYTVFEIIDHNELDPEYLMMWFRRPEFDRYARYKSHGSVREIFGWDEMCDVELPIPSIEKQREIVREYNTIVNRIQLNEQMNQKLEETAQAIYKHWFVDFEFPISAEYAASIDKPELEGKPYKSSGGEMIFCEELDQEIPKRWSVSRISDFCKDMKNGATPKRDDPEYWDSPDIPWIKTGEISNNAIWHAEEYISHLGHKKSSTQLLPKDTVLMAMYGATAAQIAYLKFQATTNQACCAMMCKSPEDAAYLYYRLLNNQEEIKSFSIGGAQENLSKALIEKLPIYTGDDDFPNYTALSILLESKAQNSKKILNLKHLANLLLSGIASAEYKEELAA
jgi:type I restriction enzyme S subunit